MRNFDSRETTDPIGIVCLLSSILLTVTDELLLIGNYLKITLGLNQFTKFVAPLLNFLLET